MPLSIAASAVLACVIVGVSDGDTLTARCESSTETAAQTLKVRLAEIDAPEKAQPFGATSKAHLATLCFGRAAQVRAQTVDRYGRTVARVWCEGVDANAEQVRVGLAWAYECYLKDERLRVAQTEARLALFRYIEGWYNPRRRHSALGYRSPMNFQKEMMNTHANETHLAA